MESENEAQSKTNTINDEPFMLSKLLNRQFIVRKFQYYLQKYQILNFMVVGGIGWLINLGLYSLLLLAPTLKKVQWNFLGKDHPNYLLPFIISSLVAIMCNYLMNRVSTFKGWKEQKSGFSRYLLMGISTLFLDMGLLVVLVKYGNLPYVAGAALAILIVFVVRFTIARKWVWSKKS